MIVSIGSGVASRVGNGTDDDANTPVKGPGQGGDPGLGTGDSLPEWLADLAPALIGEEAERAADAWVRCGDELRRRTRQFVRRAMCGMPCHLLDTRSGQLVSASYFIDDLAEAFVVEANESSTVPTETDGASRILDTYCEQDSGEQMVRECQLADIRNIWLCADNELARRAYGQLHSELAGKVDPELVMLIDAPDGPLGLVEQGTEAREEFLDSMAVLIAAQRVRREPDVACCRRIEGTPPPEARLRPHGKSLQSQHLSGPICAWLAQAADDLLPHPSGSHLQVEADADMGIDAFAPMR